jgi:drug/metabolite transporter (DMT)-like permease
MSAQLLALLAALSFALGSVLQQRGTLATKAKEGDPRFLLELFRKPVWLAGGALQGLGWIFQAAALDKGSLIVVQSICALSLVIALPIGARLTGQQIGRRTIIGALATMIGLVAFLYLGQPQGGISNPSNQAWLAAGLLILFVVFVLAWLARTRRGPVSAALFATAAGICFGFQAAITKEFVTLIGNGSQAILQSWTTYALLLSALGGFAFLQSALKTGFLAPSMAGNNAANLTTSVLLGVLVFQETLYSSQARLSPAVLGLALAVLGVFLLASPESRPSQAPAV